MRWDDDELVSAAMRLTEEALRCGKSMVDLPTAPEFINVRVTDRDGNLLDGSRWPNDPNLESSWTYDASGQRMHKKYVVIPIGVVQSNGENFTIKLDDFGKDGKPIRYEQHAVDMALSLTVWKAQGSTFDRVIALLEGSENAPAWQFEHIYVAAARVRTSESLRCLQTTLFADRNKILALRPNVFTVEWLMDLDSNGKWKQRNTHKLSSNNIRRTH